MQSQPTPERDSQAREIADQITELLGQMDALTFHPAVGQIVVPGIGTIRRAGAEWIVDTRH